mgnify:CR=1 FL=1
MAHVDSATTSGNLNLTLQNNGLAPFTSPLTACVRVTSSHFSIRPSAPDWYPSAQYSACTAIAALGARQAATLPLLPALWTKEGSHLEIEVAVLPAEHASTVDTIQSISEAEDLAIFRIRISSDEETLRKCELLAPVASLASAFRPVRRTPDNRLRRV